ncbi:MAG: esterase [Bacteroidales bacterium]|nr:esterase [Bacteroidales bacterium]
MKTICYNNFFNVFLLVMALLVSSRLLAQPGIPGLSSSSYPLVNPDRTVTFTLNAPNADTVELMFGSMGSFPFAGDDKGMWTVTIGPLEPALYTYALVVDGLRIVDPLNPELQGGTAPGFNLLNVPGDPPRFDELQEVPHGAVHIRTYYSTVQDRFHKAFVYVPPGYDREPDRKYPVLYLRHGGGGNETSWYNEGCAGIILDNLLAEGKAEPMIIVMTNGNVETGVPGGYNDEAIAVTSDELFTDVIPLVEAHYRVYTDQQNTAVAGLSMGGGQSFYIGLRNKEKFAYVGVFSTGLFGGIGGTEFDAESAIPGLLSDAAFFNENLQLFYLSCGEQDPRLEPTKQLIDNFRQHGLDVEFETYPGSHEWIVWRLSLADFLPRLFN